MQTDEECIVLNVWMYCYSISFVNDTATTKIYTLHIVGSVRCV